MNDGRDFSALHAAMDAYVASEILPGLSIVLLHDGNVIDRYTTGFADIDTKEPLTEEHIFRVYSNTKLITSCCALMLWEEGQFGLDDPIEAYIPALGNLSVLKPDAKAAHETEPCERSITPRMLLTHMSGLSYHFTDPNSLIGNLYQQHGVNNPENTLAQMMEILGEVPLVCQPGSRWEYSVSTDVVARLIEVVSGQSFGAFVRDRITAPLGMEDTDFWVPPDKHNRFIKHYRGADLTDPTKPGLTLMTEPEFNDNYTQKMPFESGGGGLVSTLADTEKLLRGLISEEEPLLGSKSFALLEKNLLPKDVWIGFPGIGSLPGKGFGAGGAVSVETYPREHPKAKNDIWWGGLAGTQWWISPENRFAGAIMAQRHMAFVHPFAATLKAMSYYSVFGKEPSEQG